jgi:hypothetical protein
VFGVFLKFWVYLFLGVVLASFYVAHEPDVRKGPFAQTAPVAPPFLPEIVQAEIL